MSKPRILAIDDEKELLASITKILERSGNAVLTANSGEEGLLALQEDRPPDMVLTDLVMPGIGGMELLRAVRRKYPEVPVVLMTAHATLETAIQAIREGAYDYLPKPFGQEELLVMVQRTLGHLKLTRENRRLRTQLGAQKQEGARGLVGDSAGMERIRELLERVAPTDLSVLITGESGTGKEVVARALHTLSNRTGKQFVPVDCAAIPANLMESELFGHEKGAFTGATGIRKGLVEAADGGTFFLDEIGELAPAMQVKLLRLLQEQEFRRVGGNQLHRVQLRVVAATNRDLETMVREGGFREDLFHRLNVVQIVLPPLRERPDDVAILLKHFMERFCAEQGRDDLRLGQEVLDALASYSWPGNVRELVNCARYVVNLCQDSVVQIQDLPQRLRQLERGEARGAAPVEINRYEGGGSFQGPSIRYDLPYKKAKRMWLEVFEFAYISRALKEHKGNVSHAARAAGIDRKSIQRLLKRNQMVKPGESGGTTEEGG